MDERYIMDKMEKVGIAKGGCKLGYKEHFKFF